MTESHIYEGEVEYFDADGHHQDRCLVAVDTEDPEKAMTAAANNLQVQAGVRRLPDALPELICSTSASD